LIGLTFTNMKGVCNMRCTPMCIVLSILLMTGCSRNLCNKIPSWDGQSIKDFEGKTMTSMLWLWPPPHQDGAEYCLEQSNVFKRFDETDFKVLLSCLDNPEVKQPVKQGWLGRYLYLSFLDGSHYLINFRDSYPFPEKNGKYTVILPNGRSQRLYKLLMEKEPSPEFEMPPAMDKYGRADPNIIMQ